MHLRIEAFGCLTTLPRSSVSSGEHRPPLRREPYAGTAQTFLPVGKATILAGSVFSQSVYIITSRRRSTAVILR